MKHLRIIRLSLITFVSLIFLAGCGYRAVPSQYDLKLKTKMNELDCDKGGTLINLEITIDSRRYQDLSSDNNIFLSYHLTDSAGNVITRDGIRTPLIPIKARGIEKETLEILVPLEKGDYLVEADLVEEGVTWFSSQGMETVELPLHVQNTSIPDYTGVILLASAISTTTANSADTPLSITVIIQNESGIALCSSGSESTLLSYLVKDKNGVILAEGERVKLSDNLPTGQSSEVTFTPQTELLNKPGDYMIEIDLLREGMVWFKDLGTTPLQIPVTIK
ncbi:MAG: hypothetical protein LUH21_18850 [Clostridiales bacterium]|nr:hypothetical protein [Clostridiales bacterium]